MRYGWPTMKKKITVAFEKDLRKAFNETDKKKRSTAISEIDSKIHSKIILTSSLEILSFFDTFLIISFLVYVIFSMTIIFLN